MVHRTTDVDRIIQPVLVETSVHVESLLCILFGTVHSADICPVTRRCATFVRLHCSSGQVSVKPPSKIRMLIPIMLPRPLRRSAVIGYRSLNGAGYCTLPATPVSAP